MHSGGLARLPVWGSWIGSKADSEAVVETSVLRDDFDEEPVNNGSVTFGNWQLVGHSKATNKFCGKYIGLKGCLRVYLHNIVTLDGRSFKGKIFRRVVHHFCNKPSCPVCFKRGWCLRQAGSIEHRLAEASKRYGTVEHIICSVPVKDYGLSYEALRKKADKVLASRRVIGYVKIFHGCRYNKCKRWYFSPHFHVLGFILGGFERCRGCKKSCLGCDGFKERQRSLYYKDNYIVKVLGRRKTVFGTAYYQLTHATIDVTKKRFHVATWAGVCSYRKMKVTPEKRRELCPACQCELIDIEYLGIKSLSSERDSFEDYEENGFPAWGEKAKPYYR